MVDWDKKLVCSYSGEEIKGMPYKCKFCGKWFSEDYRLPEKHECTGLKKFNDKGNFYKDRFEVKKARKPRKKVKKKKWYQFWK